VRFTSRFHLMPRLRISGAIPLLPSTPLYCKLRELCLYLSLLLTFLVGVTIVDDHLESALSTVGLERDFMRLSSIMWFWPFYHHMTDSRQVSPTTRCLANNGTFTFTAICDPVVGTQHSL
jgi:hypothetical protein